MVRAEHPLSRFEKSSSKIDQRLYAPFDTYLPPTVCFNCGCIHSTQKCEMPNYFRRCYRCLIISFDGSGHCQPCAPINSISELRQEICSKKPLVMFQLRLKHNGGVMHHLNGISRRFEELTDGHCLLSQSTNGLFSFKTHISSDVLSYMATEYRRFSVAIAVWVGEVWRLRFRVVPTATNGLMLFKTSSQLYSQNGVINLPPDTHQNTVLILGIKPISKLAPVQMEFRVLADKDGRIDYKSYSSYVHSASWKSTLGCPKGTYVIDDEINSDTKKATKKFDHSLYEEIPQALAPFRAY